MESLQRLQRTLLDQMQCFNCYYYDWRQPEDKRTLVRCAACHLITYCSKQCQTEHWHKMTGQFSTNEEHTVSLLFRILYKLKICGDRELIQRPELYDKVEQHLKNIWEVILQTALVDSLTQKELGDWRFRSLPPLSQGISNASMEWLTARLHDLREKGDIRPWEIFLHLLAIMAFLSKVYEMRMIGLDNLPVLDPAIMRHLRKQLPPEKYHDKWRQLLDTMPGVMAPRRVTIRIMYEILSQECIGCFRQLNEGWIAKEIQTRHVCLKVILTYVMINFLQRSY